MTSTRPTGPCLHRATLLSLAVLALAPATGRADPPPAPQVSSGARAMQPPQRPRLPMLPRVQLPTASEADDAAVNSASASPFGKAAAPNATTPGQALTAPVTVNANASTNAMTISQTGTGSAMSATVNNASSATSAVKGLSNGKGAGIYGNNSGAGGQAGKFEITSASSVQPAVLATTTGSGSGLQAILKNAAGTDVPAVLGQNNTKAFYGTGVKGEGGYIGVMGSSGSSGYGVYGSNTSGIAVFGESTSGVGTYGLSSSSYGVYGYSSTNAGVYGESNSNFGVYAYSENAYGLVAQSGATFAGVFYGPVYVSGTVTANSYGYTSDREQKQDAADVDSADVLTRIAAMPITEWRYKTKPTERHIGPMAQDFHAAFGLGADDKHIDVVDGVGVSLAAIKALQRQVEEKTARIDLLEAKLQLLQQAVEARFAALETSATVSDTTVAAVASQP